MSNDNDYYYELGYDLGYDMIHRSSDVYFHLEFPSLDDLRRFETGRADGVRAAMAQFD